MPYCHWCSKEISGNGWCSQRCITHHKTQDPVGYKNSLKGATIREEVIGFFISLGVLVIIVSAFVFAAECAQAR